MNDIVERLREGARGQGCEAADEIERLRSRLAEAERECETALYEAGQRLAEAEALLREAGGAVVAAILADEDTASQKPWIGCWPISYTYLRGRIDAFLEGSHEKAD